MKPLHENRLFAALASTRLGIVLGFAVAGLLALSSLMVPDPRGKDPLPFSESIRAFVDPPSPEFWWFYLLVAAVLAWGVNGVFGTWRTWIVRAGVRDLRFVGVFLVHLGFLVALLAHLVAGLTAGVEERVVLSSIPTEVAGRSLRVVDVRTAENPDGSMRSLVATVDLGNGKEGTLGYNQPLFFDGFTRFLLLQEPRPLPRHFAHGPMATRIALVVVFLVALSINWFRGVDLECGCFTVSGSAKGAIGSAGRLSHTYSVRSVTSR